MTVNPTDTFNPGPLGDRLLSWREVRVLSGISRTTAWRLQNAGEFPRPVMISPGRVGWRESDVAAWRASLIPRGRSRSGLFCRSDPSSIGAVPSEASEFSTRPASAPNPSPAAPAPRAPRRRRSAPPAQLSFDF